MENDKNIEHINDMRGEGESACCGADLINDICMDCKEHSGVAEDEDEDESADNKKVATNEPLPDNVISAEEEKTNRHSHDI